MRLPFLPIDRISGFLCGFFPERLFVLVPHTETGSGADKGEYRDGVDEPRVRDVLRIADAQRTGNVHCGNAPGNQQAAKRTRILERTGQDFSADAKLIIGFFKGLRSYNDRNGLHASGSKRDDIAIEKREQNERETVLNDLQQALLRDHVHDAGGIDKRAHRTCKDVNDKQLCHAGDTAAIEHLVDKCAGVDAEAIVSVVQKVNEVDMLENQREYDTDENGQPHAEQRREPENGNQQDQNSREDQQNGNY